MNHKQALEASKHNPAGVMKVLSVDKPTKGDFCE